MTIDVTIVDVVQSFSVSPVGFSRPLMLGTNHQRQQHQHQYQHYQYRLDYSHEDIILPELMENTNEQQQQQQETPQQILDTTMEFGGVFGSGGGPIIVDEDIPNNSKKNNEHDSADNNADMMHDETGGDDLDWFRFASIDELYSSPPSSIDGSDAMNTADSTNNSMEANNDASAKTEDVLERLQSSTVAVVGLSGVGTWTADALCRSGVGHFILIDLDDVCISQTTSSLTSLASNVGKFKTDTLRERLHDIHPTVQVDLINDFVKDGNNVDDIVSELVSRGVDVVIDTIDNVNDKTALWKSCYSQGIQSIITTGNPGGRKDPTQIVYRTLQDVSSADESLLACRDHLDQQKMKNMDHETHHALPTKVLCVYSEEEPNKAPFGGECIGSVSFVSGSLGFVAASQAIERLLE